MKPLTPKQVEDVYQKIFTRMRESDFAEMLLRLQRQTSFECLKGLKLN